MWRVSLRPWSAAARLVALVLLGAITALGHAPYSAPAAAVAGLAGALLVLRGSGRTLGALGGMVYAVGLFTVLVSWTGRFGAPALVAVVVSQAVFFAPFGVATASARGAWSSVVVPAATLTLLEAARARWPLGGFEWGQLGYVWHATPVRSLAALIGVLGLTALTAVAAGVLALIVHRRHVTLKSVTVAVAAASLVAAGASVTWTAPAGGIDVAVFQIAPVCDGPVVACQSEDERLLEAFAEQTRSANRRPDLVVWGEGALSGATVEAGGARAVAAGGIRSKLLAGVTAPAGDGKFLNANALYDADGRLLARYVKRHPVPFGEYVPLRRLLGGVSAVGALVPADMVRGVQPGQLPLHGTLLGTVSSFEASFAREVRAAAADRDVQAVMVLTSASSYGRSAASDQFLAMAQLRAAELQKPVVVAATTGRSAVFDPGGRRVAVTGLLQADVMEARVPLRGGTTPFGRVGDAPVAVASATAVLVAAATPLVTGRAARRRRVAARREANASMDERRARLPEGA